MSAGRRVWFSVRLRVPVGRVTERHGWLVEGPAGWGEHSPLPSWTHAEGEAAGRAATEAAATSFPPARRDQVAVNAMVPRISPEAAARLALESGCPTIKIKVGDEAGMDRVRAVRDAAGPAARLRLDANGAWDVTTAARELRRLDPLDLELVEDPVPTLEELARLRRRVRPPLAAEMPVRTVDDARRLRALDAADAVVLKPQRLGGVRAALAAAEAAGVPAIASSALETSVGLAAVLALAAALPEGPYAHGVGTALLLEEDVCADPLLPRAGLLSPRRVVPDLSRLTEAAHD